MSSRAAKRNGRDNCSPGGVMATPDKALWGRENMSKSSATERKWSVESRQSNLSLVSGHPAVGNSWVQHQLGSTTVGAHDMRRICAHMSPHMTYAAYVLDMYVVDVRTHQNMSAPPAHPHMHTPQKTHTHTHTRVCTDVDIPHMTCAAYVRTCHPAYDMRRICHAPHMCAHVTQAQLLPTAGYPSPR